MKSNKKQIENELRGKIAKQYTGKIQYLEDKIKHLQTEKNDAYLRVQKAEHTMLDMKDKLQQYEDWNNRLMEFMNMSDQDRQTYLENMRQEAQINSRMNGLLDSPIFRVLSML